MEGSPLTVLEALASEVPCVAYDTGGVKETVISRNTGFCVENYNYQSFLKSIIYLLDNPDLVKRFGVNGRKLMEDKHDWRINTEKIVKVYRDLI